ncbi:MAG: ABC transporter ATP-binding protein [Tissierellia bacterium]|nr:ABC transporter ATP-binding protein [Tissierellia bacterium]
MLKHYKDFLREKTGRYLMGIFLLLLVDSIQLFVPQVLKTYTDKLEASQIVMGEIWKIAAVIGALAILMAILRYLWRIMIVFTALEFEIWTRKKLYKHWTALPREYFNGVKTGELMSYATNDIGTIRRTFSGGVIMGVDAIFMTITTVVVMGTTIDWKLTFFAILPMPFIVYGVLHMGKIVHDKFRRVQEIFSQLSDKVQESFSGISVIKAFSQEELDLDDFEQINELNFNENMSLAKFQAKLYPTVRFIGRSSMIIGVILGARAVLNSTISLGDYVAFIKYLEILVWPVMAIGMVTNLIQRGLASMGRVNDVLDVNSNLKDSDNPKEAQGYNLEVKGLSFSYPGVNERALEDISFNLKEGGSLGILGPTGSGKSTLVSLLLRLYNIPQGSVYLGGQDINELSVKDTRDIFAMVPQDNFLFSTEIINNISLSDKEPNEDRVIQAAKDAQVHDEIMDFPQGYETFLGEKGVNLSGGQKQRTSIARALYKDSPILIFDDSLSAVDTKTEEAILRKLRVELSKHSSIIISHRISTLQNLDEIIFLDQGRIVERGSHEELLALGGRYYSIYEKQLLEDKIRGAGYESI